MYRNCKLPPTWRHPCLSCLSCLTCMCMHVCACVHICAWDTPYTPIHTPTPFTHLPPPRGPKNRSKFNNTWSNQDISILFEDLKSVENSPPIGGCMIWWKGGWVDGWDQVKSLKFNKCWLNQDNSILFEDLWFVETPPPMGRCVGGWVDGWVNGWGQVKWLKI